MFNIYFAGPQPQKPHPAAPAEFKEAFPNFLEKYKNFSLSSTTSSNGKNLGKPIFNEFWEAPEYLWQPKIRNLEESEIDAVLVSLMALIPGPVITVHDTERWCVLAVRMAGLQHNNGDLDNNGRRLLIQTLMEYSTFNLSPRMQIGARRVRYRRTFATVPASPQPLLHF